MIKENVKIDINKVNATFGERERLINVGIQHKINEYQTRGFIVVDHTVLNKTEKFATVSVTLKPMKRI